VADLPDNQRNALEASHLACIGAATCDSNVKLPGAASSEAYQETPMLTVPRRAPNVTVNRCAVCDGKFGLVRYYAWRTALCSKKCRERFRAREVNNFRWLRRIEAAPALVP
jgi:hypothetical protein